VNYGELKTLVQQYLECEETTFVDNIDQFVKLAEDDIFRQVQLQDLMKTDTGTTVLNVQNIALPGDFLSIYSVSIKVNGVYQMLLSKDYSFIREVYADDTATGIPRFYAFYDEANLMLGPVPNAAYPVEFNYFFEPTSLTAGGDSGTTWLSENGEQALLFGTVVQGYIYLKGDQDVIAQYTNQYQSALAALKIIAEGRNRKDSYRKSDRRIPV